jgi:cytochrome c-type biogenesis protein CcmH/NrfG
MTAQSVMTEGTGAGKRGRSMRIQLTIAFMCLALLVYLALLGRAAVLMIGSGRAVAIVLGVALLILPAIGLWAMIATLRAGFAHQKLARLAAEDGMELDVSALPRRPSGRVERAAADALFDRVRSELHSDPDDWRCWYRLARAYDYAGDRSRAREAMKTAVELHRALQDRK